MKEPFLEKPLRRLRIRKILKYIPKNGVICDIGCGPEPNFLLNLGEKIGEGWGIDKKTISKKWSDRVQTIRYDLDSIDNISLLPFSENKFDCLLVIAVSEHLKFLEKVLKESHRILKPGGIIVLTTPTIIAKPILEFLAFRTNMVSREEIKDHKYYYSKKELINILNASGFGNIKHHYFELRFNQIIIAQK